MLILSHYVLNVEFPFNLTDKMSFSSVISTTNWFSLWTVARTMQTTTHSGPRTRSLPLASLWPAWRLGPWSWTFCARRRSLCLRFWSGLGRRRTAAWLTWRSSLVSTSCRVRSLSFLRLLRYRARLFLCCVLNFPLFCFFHHCFSGWFSGWSVWHFLCIVFFCWFGKNNICSMRVFTCYCGKSYSSLLHVELYKKNYMFLIPKTVSFTLFESFTYLPKIWQWTSKC